MLEFQFQLLLAAGPAISPATPPPPSSDPLSPLYILIGSTVVLQLIALIVGGVKWLAGRTVEREDKDKEDLRAAIKKHDERFEEQDDAIAALDKSVIALQSEVKQVMHALEGIRGGVSEVKLGLDQRFEKQADFYRGQVKELGVEVGKKLDELEYRLRQDAARAMHDASALARGRGKSR